MTKDELSKYIFDTYGVSGDNPWPKYPDNIVFRHTNNKKWFGLLMSVLESRLGEDGERMLDILNVKCDPLIIGSITKEKGIYGILAGGDFEAESLLFPGIWNQIAEELNDDVIFCIPTKDIVFYTAEGNRKLRNKMLKMAADMFESNRRETPHLLFSRDVFVCSKKDRKLTVSRRYTI